MVRCRRGMCGGSRVSGRRDPAGGQRGWLRGRGRWRRSGRLRGSLQTAVGRRVTGRAGRLRDVTGGRVRSRAWARARRRDPGDSGLSACRRLRRRRQARPDDCRLPSRPSGTPAARRRGTRWHAGSMPG